MVKLIIFFRKPADTDAFEEHFSSQHVPLVDAMPGIKRTAVVRAIGAPRGDAPYHLIHEVYFDDMAALTYALNSAEGRAAGADLSLFARDIASLMFAEVWGEDPFELGMGSEPGPAEAEAEAESVGGVETVAGPDAGEGVNSVVGVSGVAASTAVSGESNQSVSDKLVEVAPRDVMVELEKDFAAYRKVPIDVSFLEKPREAAEETVAEAESRISSLQSPSAIATTTDIPDPDLDSRRPPQPSPAEPQP